MNDDIDNGKQNDIDPAVARHYSAASDDKTPPRLDRAVMREAKRAIQADDRRGVFGSWRRPLAFVATLGLSLAIILEFSETGIFGPGPDTLTDAVPVTGSPAQTIPDTATGDRLRPALNELKRQEKSGTADPLASESQTVEPADADAAMADDVRTPAASRSAQSKFKSEPPPAAEAESRDASVATDAEAYRQMSDTDRDAVPQSSPVPAECGENQQSAPETWWQCIEALREAGQAAAARREFGELRQRFPGFEPPQ